MKRVVWWTRQGKNQLPVAAEAVDQKINQAADQLPKAAEKTLEVFRLVNNWQKKV